MADDRNILYKIEQNATNFILITQSEFNGKDYIDVRKYFLNDKGQQIATKKGLMVSPDEWKEICILLNDYLKFDENEKEANVPKAEDFISNEPDTSSFDYKALDEVILSDNDPFNDGVFPF